MEGKSETSTCGDQITLQAIADLFAVNIQVVLPSGVNNCILTLQYVLPINTIQLGYLPEGHGDHYESILGNPNAEPADESTELSEEDHYEIIVRNPNAEPADESTGLSEEDHYEIIVRNPNAEPADESTGLSEEDHYEIIVRNPNAEPADESAKLADVDRHAVEPDRQME